MLKNVQLPQFVEVSSITVEEKVQGLHFRPMVIQGSLFNANLMIRDSKIVSRHAGIMLEQIWE